MKLKHLESLLQQVQPFSRPQIQLEQYQTSARIAASLLMDQEDLITGSSVLDLGCGSGILTAGPLFLGAEYVLAVDIDPDALSICQRNLISCFDGDDDGDSDDGGHGADKRRTGSPAAPYDLMLADVCHMPLLSVHTATGGAFDCVIMNPPFGTRNPGIDITFLQTALALVDQRDGCVLSLHKSSTRDGIRRRCQRWDVDMEVVAEVRFDLPASYAFHKKKSADVLVDFIRFSKK